MRSLAVVVAVVVAVAASLVAGSAVADRARAPRTRILVLPLAPTHAVSANAARAFDARLLVALDDTGRVQTVTDDEEPECTTLSCLADVGKRAKAAYVLQLATVPEGSTLTVFGTLIDVASKSAWRRIELPKVAPRALARAPAELVPQVLGTRGPTVLAFARPTDGTARTMVEDLAKRITALHAFKVLPLDTSDRSPPTHRAELVVTELSITEPRRGLCKWYDGTLVGTFAVTDLSNGRVVWSKAIRVEASRRVHFSSRSDVVDELVDRAVARWSTAFRTSGVLRRHR